MPVKERSVLPQIHVDVEKVGAGKNTRKYIELEEVGTVIREEFFEPYGVSVDDVAGATTIPGWDLAAIIYGGKQISAEADLLLTKYFGLSQGYFLRMQDTYNMRLAKQKLRGTLKNIISVFDQTKKVAAYYIIV